MNTPKPEPEHPSFMLWKLGRYLSRMRPDHQTIMVMMKDKPTEFGFTKGYRLGDPFSQLGYRESVAVALADMGLDPMARSTVYAYVERRHPAFVDPYYGWGVERQ